MISEPTTSKEKKIEFLTNRIQHQIDGFERRRKENRNRAIRLNVLSVAGGVAVTVLLGINIENFEEIIALVALVLSGLVTLANALEGVFGYKQLWIQYTVTTNALRAMRDDLQYLQLDEADETSLEKVDTIYSRYSSLLNETNAAWTKVREEQFASNPQNT